MSFNSVSGGCGSGSSRGGRQFQDHQNPRFCECQTDGRRLRAVIMTSWTDENPGRRFYGCRNWKMKNCGYFDWLDEPISERAKDVINELKVMKNKESSSLEPMDMEIEFAKIWNVIEMLKEDSNKNKKKSRLVTAMLVVSWLFIAYYALV
ncbi:uncharacterized protein LOC130990642 [Salvia miltiorrhiza]|uniref:uncharacterized protein LOC130990642 n=1 Tax=Salvia miltiorrhiza TaxID=226208 RepID=UPI0025AD9683|nr:uncharacterized protein LOC130990642 [Salvia miltiorrhiza]